MSCKKIDIFVCSETWLTSHHDSGMVSIADYACYRADRDDRIGGGVAVWVRESYSVSHLSSEILPEIEHIILRLLNFRILLFAVYIPPQFARLQERLTDFFVSCLDRALDGCPDYDVVFAGDLNRFDISDLCSSLNLRNVNKRPTYGNAELDYIIFAENFSANYKLDVCSPLDRF